MRNGFTDFFETLITREITVYVIPGSVVLGTILWCYNLFPKITDELKTATYITLTTIWIAVAYTIGLIVAGIREGILHEPIKKYRQQASQELSPLCLLTKRLQKIVKRIERLKDKPEELLQKIEELRNEIKELKHQQQHDNTAVKSMYISLRQETMYRREIERYGVFANSLENLATALGFVVIILISKMIIAPKENLIFEFVLIFILLAIILSLPIGAEGYRTLQKDRINTLFEAMYPNFSTLISTSSTTTASSGDPTSPPPN